VARAKGEIFTGLGEDGVAVINADDDYASLWRDLAGQRRCVFFGMKNPAEVMATETHYAGRFNGTRFVLHTPAGSAEVRLPLPGRHNIMNALAAAACAHALGIEPGTIAQGLEATRPVHGRLELREGAGGVRILDDSYNANPGSLKAALEFLTECPGERWLVLGDMGELGPEAGDLHFRAGAMARDLGVDRLYAFGELCRRAVEGFGPFARHFGDAEALLEALRRDLHPKVTLLVKGSRSMRMERVVGALEQDCLPPCSSF
jgi:UDP-N-acetylmuramoyl-tripeptide--D-alanyl-D-alanine ligase